MVREPSLCPSSPRLAPTFAKKTAKMMGDFALMLAVVSITITATERSRRRAPASMAAAPTCGDSGWGSGWGVEGWGLKRVEGLRVESG